MWILHETVTTTRARTVCFQWLTQEAHNNYLQTEGENVSLRRAG